MGNYLEIARKFVAERAAADPEREWIVPLRPGQPPAPDTRCQTPDCLGGKGFDWVWSDVNHTWQCGYCRASASPNAETS